MARGGRAPPSPERPHSRTCSVLYGGLFQDRILIQSNSRHTLIDMTKRDLTEVLKATAAKFPAITLTGPRQSVLSTF
jgi:hypothetical protein